MRGAGESEAIQSGKSYTMDKLHGTFISFKILVCLMLSSFFLHMSLLSFACQLLSILFKVVWWRKFMAKLVEYLMGLRRNKMRENSKHKAGTWAKRN